MNFESLFDELLDFPGNFVNFQFEMSPPAGPQAVSVGENSAMNAEGSQAGAKDEQTIKTYYKTKIEDAQVCRQRSYLGTRAHCLLISRFFIRTTTLLFEMIIRVDCLFSS